MPPMDRARDGAEAAATSTFVNSLLGPRARRCGENLSKPVIAGV